MRHTFKTGDVYIDMSSAVFTALCLMLTRYHREDGSRMFFVKAIQLLRELHGIGLKEAKDIADFISEFGEFVNDTARIRPSSGVQYRAESES